MRPMTVENKGTLLMCTLAHAVNHTQILIIAALLPMFKEIYGLSYLMTEAIIAVYLLFYALLNPLTGVLFQGASKKLLVAMGKAVSGGALGVMAMVQGYVPLVATQALFGSAGGMYHPAGTSLLAERYGREIRGRVMGVHGFGSSLGMILGPLLIAFFISSFDYRFALKVFAGVSVLFGLVFYYTVKEDGQRGKGPDIGSMLRKRRFRVVVAAFGLRESVFWGIKAFLPLYAVAVYNFSLPSAAALLAFLPVVGLLANLLGGFLADKYDRVQVTRVAVMLTAVSLGGFYFFTGEGAFYLLVGLTALGIYMTLPTFDSILADITPEDGYVKAYGAMYGVGFFLGALIPLGLGLLSDYVEPRASFLLLSGVMLL
ncbi:MAG: MFS transporter, partial [Candidatus Hydrothermarchaeota archaeon]|nr:MFS transporter [Candidatus Hydrothermarchaeota archaeon]